MGETSAVECALREVVYWAFPAGCTVTVRCTVVADAGSADGYGTADSERFARLKAFSEAVERLLACTPLALVARPSTTYAAATSTDDGVRSAPPGTGLRRYRAVGEGPDRDVPLFWSSPWVSGAELAEGVLTPQLARLSSTIGWAVAPTRAQALHGAILELVELLNYGAFLLRSLEATPGEYVPDPIPDSATTISFVGGTPVVLAVSRTAGRLMPATGLGAADTVAEATARAELELAQAATMWRNNPTNVAAEQYFLRRFERWPLLQRCATLDFNPVGCTAVSSPAAPRAELATAGVRLWGDTGELLFSGPSRVPARLHYAHVVSRPQPLLGLVRAGVPVFDAGEVRKTLDHRAPGTGPADGCLEGWRAAR